MIIRKPVCLVLLMLLVGFTPANAQDYLNKFFDQANRFFSQYVYEGQVDYQSVKNNPASINALLSLANQADIKEARGDIKKAYWVNVYNLLVIKNIAEHYPLTSVATIPGFFDSARFSMQGEIQSLDRIEKNILKTGFRNPRINFLLCKDMIGSPPLPSESYRPEMLTTQTTAQIEKCLHDTNFVRPGELGQIRLSSFFSEYRDEFELAGGNLLQFINRYRDNPLPADAIVSFFEMDRSLNDNAENSASNRKELTNLAVTMHTGRGELASEADDGRMAGVIMVPFRQLEIRINNNLSSFTEFYNKRLVRTTSRYSYAANILAVQLFYGIGRKTSIGIAANGRTARLGNTSDQVSEVFTLKSDTNASFYLRSVTPVIRFNIADGYFKLRMQTYFNIRVTKTQALKYNTYRIFDENPYLLVSQIFLSRYLSEYVRLGLEADFSFKFDDKLQTASLAPRPFLNTVFSLPLNRSFRIYGLLEAAPSANLYDYLSNYYLKEGAGIKTMFGKSEVTLFYSYIFLAKNVGAFNSLVLNIRLGI